MNHCLQMRDELIEAALGAPPSEALTLHLRACAACACELDHQRALAERIDETVRSLVSAQPSTDLLEGTLTRATIARRSLPMWPRLAAATAVAAGILAFAFSLHATQPRTTRPDAAALTAWQSPTAALLVPHLLTSTRREPTPGETHEL